MLESTHNELQLRAAKSIDFALVVRNWLFGWYIVEFEQKGSDRAQYGKGLIARLSQTLKDKGFKGVSKTNLKQFRSFYLLHEKIGQTASVEFPLPERIGQTLSDQSLSTEMSAKEVLHPLVDSLSRYFTLTWSHYVVLLKCM